MNQEEAIIDGMSIEHILTARIENFLLTEPSYYGRNFSSNEREKHLINAFSALEPLDDTSEYLRWALSFCSSILEPYLLYEKIVVDENSLESVLNFNNSRDEKQKLYEKFSHLFTLENLSDKHGKAISENVEDYIEALNENGIQSIFNFKAIPHEDLTREKSLALMDGVMNDVNSSLFGNSMNSPLRALFYHELSRESGKALILHPDKQGILKELQRTLALDRKTLLSRLSQNVCDKLFDRSVRLSVPPLAFMIISKSYEEDRPLIDVARELRDDREISSLRNLISSLQSDENRSRVTSFESFNSKAEEISCRIKCRSKYDLPWLSKKTLYISEIPAISTVLKIFGVGNIDIPDIVLHERGYVTFYEKWAGKAPSID